MRNTIDMARDAGLFTHKEVQAELKAFEALVRADERKEILKTSADNWFKSQLDYDNAIRARLKQPEERYTYGTPLLDAFTKPTLVQEPLQPVVTKTENGVVLHAGWDDLPAGAKLYTTPPAAQRQWVGLTDEEIEKLWLKSSRNHHFGRDVETALKEKNT